MVRILYDLLLKLNGLEKIEEVLKRRRERQIQNKKVRKSFPNTGGIKLFKNNTFYFRLSSRRLRRKLLKKNLKNNIKIEH